ncbi:MAG TPA: DinB family protein [Pyrinomonadaceae bacterium]|jgi:hypothetical protein|nr:DinB family protein [Pyrinomonadaceae bacterium]
MQGRSHQSQDENKLTAGCVRVLEQGLALVERLDDALYSATGALPVRSGVGAHFRHCVDFFEGFLAGARSGRVDYERRERDPLVARDRAFAATKLRIIIAELRTLPFADGDAPLKVSLEDEADSAPDSPRWCVSTVSRELQFLLSHTVHHYALVALVLRLQGFEPGAEFGVAPSTLRHWRSKAGAHQERNADGAGAREDAGARDGAVTQVDAGAHEDVGVRGLSSVFEEEAVCAL